MPDNLRDRIEAVLWEHFDEAAPSLSMWEMAEAVIAAIDRDYIIVEPGTPLAQKIVEWQWENNG